jgi:hypothetical protein
MSRVCRGLSLDPEKIEVIENMPDPANTTSITRLLGMLTYLDTVLPQNHFSSDNFR